MNEQLDRIEVKLAELEGKIDATFASAERTRKILWWTGVISILVIVGPLLLLPFFLPMFFSAEGLGSASSMGF
jgi:type II secretory pathway component PulM